MKIKISLRRSVEKLKSRDNSPLPARYQSKHKRYFYVFKKQSRLTHRRTGNRGQTCLPVGLKVIDNSPLPARYQIMLRFNGRVRGSLKPSPLSIADFRLLCTHVVLVQASISSMHHITKPEQSYKEPANFYQIRQSITSIGYDIT